MLEGEQNGSLLRVHSAQCSASERWGFSPKLFINPFRSLKLDFHLKKKQNLDVPTQHTLQALLQPLQFVFWWDTAQIGDLGLPLPALSIAAVHRAPAPLSHGQPRPNSL